MRLKKGQRSRPGIGPWASKFAAFPAHGRAACAVLNRSPLAAEARMNRSSHSWAVKSLLLGLFGSALDYALLFSTVNLLSFPIPLGAALGLTAGATFNFLMNRRFAFRAQSGAMGSQAFRYVGAMGALLGLHVGAMWLLVDRAGLPLAIAKPACDLILLGLGQLLVFRYVVFRRSVTSGAQFLRPVSA